MIDVAVGIDIGTTYTKAIARMEDGNVIAVHRVRSPQFGTTQSTNLLDATEWWTRLKDVFRGLLAVKTHEPIHVISICVSAIAPTLTVFDKVQEKRAYAILYSSLAVLKDGSSLSLSQSDSKLTEYRLEVLKDVARKENFISPCISDLVGYLNWCLTSILTMNSISLVEMGLVKGQIDCEKFVVIDNSVPRLVAPGQQIGEITDLIAEELGIETGIPVCGGCPDTMSSVVGAGLTQASETMLYLGTFGSFMRLETDVQTLLNVASCTTHPFRWMLSIPGLGPEIESLGHQWFSPTSEAGRLQMLDHEAMQSPPGADGTLFLVPRWKNGMTPIGRYRFVTSRTGEIGNSQRKCRAVLEGVAYAVLAMGVHMGDYIKVSGGGARSHSWLDIISFVLNREIRARYMTWEAIGTADIAAGLVWPSKGLIRPYYIPERNVEESRAAIDDNVQRIKEYYYELGWL